MGNDQSSPIGGQQDHLRRNRSSSSTSSNTGLKFTMVYQDTPAIVYRPANYQEALDQARHTFQIPRYQPLEFSYNYLTIGLVTLNSENWSSVLPTIHTLFISTPGWSPPPPRLPTPARTPGAAGDHRPYSTIILDSSPVTRNVSVVTTVSAYTQSEESDHVLPDSQGEGPRQPQKALPLPPLTSLGGDHSSPSSHSRQPATVPDSPLNSLPATPDIPSFSIATPPTTSQGRRPLPSIDRQATITPLNAFNPSPIAYTPAQPRQIAFTVRCADTSESKTLRLPENYLVADLRDLLADAFIMPIYVQELLVNGNMVEEEDNASIVDVGITDGGSVELRRAGRG